MEDLKNSLLAFMAEDEAQSIINELELQQNVTFDPCGQDSNISIVSPTSLECEENFVKLPIPETSSTSMPSVDPCSTTIMDTIEELQQLLDSRMDDSIMDKLSFSMMEVVVSFINKIIHTNANESYDHIDYGIIDSVILDNEEALLFSSTISSINNLIENHTIPNDTKELDYNNIVNNHYSTILSLIRNTIDDINIINTKNTIKIDGTREGGKIFTSNQFISDLTVEENKTAKEAAYGQFDIMIGVIYEFIKNKKKGKPIKTSGDEEYELGDYGIQFLESIKYKSLSWVNQWMDIRLGSCSPAPVIDFQENISDDNHNVHISNGPSLLDIRYWRKYCAMVTTVGLIPSYWTTGLILPSPGGPVPVKLPVIWIPMMVFYVAPIINVVMITINGMIIYPVIWQHRAQPVSNNSSYFLNLFRSANVKIKEDTGVKYPINFQNLIDINPALSRNLPTIKDDLPTYERLNPTNVNFLRYINKWLTTMMPHMGFPI